MGELAQLAITARSRVSLERMHGATNVPKLLDIAGTLLERQPRFVHALEDFLGTLEEEVAELGGLFVGRKTHCAPSSRW